MYGCVWITGKGERCYGLVGSTREEGTENAVDSENETYCKAYEVSMTLKQQFLWFILGKVGYFRKKNCFRANLFKYQINSQVLMLSSRDRASGKSC